MDLKQASAQIKLLASSSENRNKTARLRDLYEDIETALKAGVSRSTINETLAKNGLNMSLGFFSNALHRIRHQQIKQSTKIKNPEIKTTNIFTPQPITEVKTNHLALNIGSHNPADLDKSRNSFVDLEALANIIKKKKA